MKFYIGTIVPFSGKFVPSNWDVCDGRELSISQNKGLFAIIGNTYGGDGKTTFALPNLPVVKNANGKRKSRFIYIICTQGICSTRD
ncbi:phage tail protein [Coleofasciculus sp.]|uniref:phage tail protein n=1 Tax=Coleofasciculus sp. TaxID=3100458 RepID=UPI003A17D8BA